MNIVLYDPDHNPYLDEDKTALDRMRSLKPGTYSEMAAVSGIPASTIARSNQLPIYRWSVKTVMGLCKYFEMSPGLFLDNLLQTYYSDGCVIDEDRRSIQGVKIGNPADFQAIKWVIERNSGMGYTPSAKDVKYLLKRLHNPSESDLKKLREEYLKKCTNALMQKRRTK